MKGLSDGELALLSISINTTQKKSETDNLRAVFSRRSGLTPATSNAKREQMSTIDPR